ncbi:DNA topoisomerase III [Butyrivibrio sp. CB08]|uniref:type IA DNA topoisomerase n=1 Tax=Butyrivibrio sp. CB08 TaxID=2364879 RepID=UPI000EA84EEA|nr:type IA DNA topoisomerase [Butyrivibrio sp. CB08]RKM61021.1 DNA topoisomerase III [Butyrivibrio sp. CB08]
MADSKKLIITEKPSVARDFARVLNVSGNQKGYIENDQYVISWCVGHLVQMLYPEAYDERYSKWRIEDLPFLPANYKYGVIEKSKDQYKIVNELLHREDIDTVYWAGDSGKEGQTIEENIRNYGGVRDGMTELRVWIDSQTDEEIRRGIAEAKPMSDYALLGESGIMRAIEDYSLGINFSRALSIKYGKLLNDAAATKSYTAIAVGRVMTCVLGMVVRREREIRDFVETPFYRIVGSFSDAKILAEWKAVEGSKFFESPLLYKENGFSKQDDAQALIDSLTGKEAVIDSIESGKTSKKAPMLFNLAELQGECSKRFKISPSQTLEVAQELYEKKLTTYPRTDARVLTTAVAKEITKNVRGLSGINEVSRFVDNVLKNGMYKGIEKSSYTDDSKVTDHYAIIPTGQTAALGSLSPLARDVYLLIVKRFLSIFYPPAQYKTAKIQVLVDGERFFASSKVLVSPGYLEVAGLPSDNKVEAGAEGGSSSEGNDEEDVGISKEDFIKFVDSAKKGDVVTVNEYQIKEGKTSPPKRYTSGTLILAMENAGNLIEDEELRAQIKKSGIGTAATRSGIIDKLITNKYLNVNKSQVITPGNLGEMIYEVVNLSIPTLLNPEMTASWEKGLEGIYNGSVDSGEYRKKLEDYIRRETNKMIGADLTASIASNISQFAGKDAKGPAGRRPIGVKCPACGGEMTTTSFGYGCSNYFNDQVKCGFSVGEIAGKRLSEEEVKQLITEGKTGVIEGFTSKNKKKFKAILVLTKDENGKHTIGFDFDGVPDEYIEGIACPVCGGKMVRTGYGVACENRGKEENGCYFNIGEVAGKKLDDETIRTLITNGTTDVIRGFKSKSKTSFDAKLVLKRNEEGKTEVGFDFEGIEPEYLEDVVCPDCGGRIIKLSAGICCENNKKDDPESCRFFIGKVAQKQLSEANVVQLLKEGKTGTIRGFKNKDKKSFDACLVLKKNEEGKSDITFDFENVEAKVVKGVLCPVCGGEIVKTSFGYGCKNYNREDPEHSCKFNIGQIAGKKLNDSQVKELLTMEVTQPISGFKSKAGKPFEAKLALSKDDAGKVTGIRFVFENEEEALEGVKCPKCGKPVIKNHWGYKCEGNQKDVEGSCDFFIGKVAGLELPKEAVIKLLTDKVTDKISGFTSKSGNSFDAMLAFDEQYRVVFKFD